MAEPPAEAPADLRIQELHRDFDRGLLDRLYEDVLEPAFSVDELEAKEAVAERLTADSEPETLVAVALGETGEPLGGLIADLDRDAQVLLLSYAAVRPDRRGQGIGSYLFQDVAGRWYREADIPLAIAEVHDPRHWTDDGDAEPRLRLYDRLGARILDMPFIQPALSSETERVPGFFLFAFHVDPVVLRSPNGVEGIPSALIARFVTNYFEDCEGISAPYDPQLTALLTEIQQAEAVELIPVSEYERVRQLSL